MQTRAIIDNAPHLYHELADLAGITIVRVDGEGYIEEASPGLDLLGVSLSEMLIFPHVADLAEAQYADDVRAYCSAVMGGRCAKDDIEFVVRSDRETKDDPASSRAGTPKSEERWFSLSLRPILTEDNRQDGAFGVLRSIDRSRALYAQSRTTQKTDQLTGLANRRAFGETLDQLRVFNSAGHVAVLEIERFRGLSLLYGPDAADDMIVAFSEFLRVMASDETYVARLHHDRFAIFIPGNDPDQAFRHAQDIVTTFAQLSKETLGNGPIVSASAGLTDLDGSLTDILMRAERSLILARAAGGTRVVRSCRSREAHI